MPEEKQPDVVSYENTPKTGLGILAYMASRIKRDTNQLVSSLKTAFNPVFTPDTDDEALLENDALSKESEDCKEPSPLAVPLDDIFDAEYKEELKKAKMNVAQYKELLKPPESVNAPIPQKTHDANTIPQFDHFSERIDVLLNPLDNKIWSLAQERGIRAAQKAGLLAKIRMQVLNLQSNIGHEHPRKDALIQAIATIRQTMIDSQNELSHYRSKWGSGFFFGTLLRRDLTKRVTSKTLIDDLTYELDDIEKAACGRIYSSNILLGTKN